MNWTKQKKGSRKAALTPGCWSIKALLCIIGCSIGSSVYCQCPNGASGPQLVVNGNFTAGNTDFTSGYQYVANNTVEGQYYVGNTAQAYQWNGGVTVRGSHINANTDFLMVNGYPSAGVDVWCETMTVTPNTDYVFSFWLTSISGCCYAVLQFYFNGVVLDTTVTAPLDTGWIPFSTTWNSGSNTSVSLCIQDQNTSRAGNDFGLTGISFMACGCNSSASGGTVSATRDSLCSGDSAQLAVSGSAGSIQWQSSADDAHFINIPGDSAVAYTTTALTQTTYYRVMATGSCNADSSAVKAIVVSPAPVAGTISAEPDTLCAGGASQLTLTGSSGNIQWQSSSDGISFTNIIGQSFPVYTSTGLLQSAYYRAEVTTTCGTDSSGVKPVTVLPSPVIGIINLAPNPVCAGSGSQLSVTGIAEPVQWQLSTSPGNFYNIPGADSVVYLTPPVFQVTDFRVVAGNGFCADTSSGFQLLVDSAPAPPRLYTPDSLICASDSARISTSGSYSSYLWSNGSQDYYTYAYDAGGYWVTVTTANGCSAVSGHQEISVYPVPSVSIIIQGDTLASFGAVSYQWYFNDNPIPDATSPLYIAGQNGNYSLEITDTNGCKALSNDTYVSVTGITGPPENNVLTIYPDPFTNTIFIKDDETGAVIQNIKIYDMLGRIALNNEYNHSAPLILPVDVSALPPGAYYIRVETNKSLYVRSIIKD